MRKPYTLIIISCFIFCKNTCAQAPDSADLLQPPALPAEKFICGNIIGEWRDQNSTIIFQNDWEFIVTYDNGNIITGSWYLSNKGFILNPQNPPSVEQVYCIFEFSATRMKYGLCDAKADKTVWSAMKLKEVNKPALGNTTHGSYFRTPQ